MLVMTRCPYLHRDLPRPSVSHAGSLIVDISKSISHQCLITISRLSANTDSMGCHVAKEICRLTGPCNRQKLDGNADLVETLLQVQLVCRQLFGHGAVLGLSC